MENLLKSLEKPKHRCPFYGFYQTSTWKPNILFGKEGNSCGFFASTHNPCQMEINSRIPNWDNCSLNTKANEETIRKIKDSYPVYPKGVRGECVWFKQWFDFVMSKGVEEIK